MGKRRVIRDPRGWIKQRTMLDSKQLRDIGIICQLAIAGMRTGHGDRKTWGILAGAVNVSLIMAENGIGKEYIEDIKAARGALIRCKERAKKLGKFGFDGDGYNAVVTVIDLYEQQLAEGNVGVIKKALDEVGRRIDAGLFAEKEKIHEQSAY